MDESDGDRECANLDSDFLSQRIVQGRPSLLVTLGREIRMPCVCECVLSAVADPARISVYQIPRACVRFEQLTFDKPPFLGEEGSRSDERYILIGATKLQLQL